MLLRAYTCCCGNLKILEAFDNIKIQELWGSNIIKVYKMSRTIEKRKARVSAFLLTLRDMLNNQGQQYIGWGSEGQSFTIRNPSRFSQEVLPKYFKHSNLSSFIRQLNIYNFKKISNEKYPDQYNYSHSYFIKDKPQLMSQIYRKINRIGSKQSQSNQNEVCFSENSNENTINMERKKLNEEIELLQKKLLSLKSTNSSVCQENLDLQRQIPEVKNYHSELQKVFYSILMDSYQFQYHSYAEKIQIHLKSQEILINQFYGKQNFSQAISPFINNSNIKINFNLSKGIQKNYNAQTQSESTINKMFNCARTSTESFSSNLKTNSQQSLYSKQRENHKENGKSFKVEANHSKYHHVNKDEVGQSFSHQKRKNSSSAVQNKTQSLKMKENSSFSSEQSNKVKGNLCVINLNSRPKHFLNSDPQQFNKIVLMRPNGYNPYAQQQYKQVQ